MYYVSRQLPYYQPGVRLVVVNAGGVDCAGADMLCRQYRGEGKEYLDPREAAKVALEIRRQWAAAGQRQAGQRGPGVAHVGAVSGSIGIEGEACSAAALRKWAAAEYESIPKCDCCGDPMPEDEGWTDCRVEEGHFCSRLCAERAGDEEERFQAELDADEAARFAELSDD
jgi:hypothetical protein